MRGNTQRDQRRLSRGCWRVRSHSLCEWPSKSRERYSLSICATWFPFKLRVNACVSNGTRVPNLLRESISVLAEMLETHGFIRIHRSVLVNTSFVEEIRPLSTGEYCLRVEGGKEYTVTRTYKRSLKSLAQFWIGTGAFFPG